MDGHNLHHFWGYSGAMDLLEVMPGRSSCKSKDEPFNLLQARSIQQLDMLLPENAFKRKVAHVDAVFRCHLTTHAIR